MSEPTVEEVPTEQAPPPAPPKPAEGENPPPAQGQAEVPEPPPLFVYAIAMMEDGEVKLVTDLPFLMVRKALFSDVQMTAGYVAQSIADGKL